MSDGPSTTSERHKPLLCLDFDGVIHSYTSGWQGATTIPDPPVPGAIEFIVAALEHFRVAIFSSRSTEPGGMKAMQDWLMMAMQLAEVPKGYLVAHYTIEWPSFKPPAFLTIDDRAVTFLGWWPDPQTLLAFKTWQQGPLPVHPLDTMAERLKAKAERKPFAWARGPYVEGGTVEFARPIWKADGQFDPPAGDGWFPLYRD